MKSTLITLAVFAVACSNIAYAQLIPDDAASKVHFTIKNFGLNTGGDFTGLKGSISYNKASIAATVFDVTVDASTVNTDNKSRDGHLRKEEYFDVAKYPELHFKSTKVIAGLGGFNTVQGMITIKGVSKAVSFPFKVIQQNGGYLFQGLLELNRRDFGVGGNSAVLSDNLKITLSVFAK
ncbi:MAG: YceI family protein [Chitinophagaceae bacterium]